MYLPRGIRPFLAEAFVPPAFSVMAEIEIVYRYKAASLYVYMCLDSGYNIVYNGAI